MRFFLPIAASYRLVKARRSGYVSGRHVQGPASSPTHSRALRLAAPGPTLSDNRSARSIHRAPAVVAGAVAHRLLRRGGLERQDHANGHTDRKAPTAHTGQPLWWTCSHIPTGEPPTTPGAVDGCWLSRATRKTIGGVVLSRRVRPFVAVRCNPPSRGYATTLSDGDRRNAQLSRDLCAMSSRTSCVVRGRPRGFGREISVPCRLNRRRRQSITVAGFRTKSRLVGPDQRERRAT